MSTQQKLMSSWRWWICSLLFVATTINYLDRQVLSLTYEEFIKPQFHWSDANYGTVTSFFSFFYALCSLFAGKFVDWMGTKKGYLTAIGVWSLGACLHALCGWATAGITGLDSVAAMRALQAGSRAALAVSTTSVYLFLLCRGILALGEAGNFPAAIKVTAEYFPKKDRAFATAIFNAGASVGALAAPLIIPSLAVELGWEWAFVIIGGLGFVWMFFWQFMYDKPQDSRRVNSAELEYIRQDEAAEQAAGACSAAECAAEVPPGAGSAAGKVNSAVAEADGSASGNIQNAAKVDQTVVRKREVAREEPQKRMSYLECFRHRQTWSFALGKFLTDGVWWFFLFWAPSYFSNQFDAPVTSPRGQALIFTLYLIVTIVSIFGGYLPRIFVEKRGMNPYKGRMLAMLIFAFAPLAALFAQPLGVHFNTPWWPAVLIGIAAAGHQAWSANLYSTVSDMFPKSAVATITGIGTMAGGLGSMIVQKVAGNLFTYAESAGEAFRFIGFCGKPAGYFVVFCFCGVAYLLAWVVMKTLVPEYKLIRPR